MRKPVRIVLLLMLLLPLMSFAGQQTDFRVSSLAPPARQAHSTLLRALFFSIGPVGYDDHISEAEVALRTLLEEKEASAALTDLLARASVAGQMYALCGLHATDRELFNQAVKRYEAEQEGEKIVGTQSGCIVMPTDVNTLLTKIELGQYDLHFKRSINRN